MTAIIPAEYFILRIMNSTDYSATVPSRRALFILTVFIVMISWIIMITASCGRGSQGTTSLTSLQPPQMPPPPPKPPSMAGSDTTWDMTDKYPMFPGGEELLGKYIAMNTSYPEEAKKKGLQGTVVVKFRITSKGKVNGYEITQSVCPELDAEALRVVKTITKFEPAIIEGKPVSAWFYMPIKFALK
jgi:TonB family protein